VSNFQNYCWVVIDIEVNGLSTPVTVVDLAAQRMRGWERSGPPFRRLLNQTGSARVEGYTPQILKRDGRPALEVYRDFAAYADGLPIVSYNLDYDLDRVLRPEWRRLGVKEIGAKGFCAFRLAKRLLDPPEAGNLKLQTLRQFYRLPERGAHTALGDVETLIDIMKGVIQCTATIKLACSPTIILAG
jgi:DNA polymerase-3 subunit epsilon